MGYVLLYFNCKLVLFPCKNFHDGSFSLYSIWLLVCIHKILKDKKMYTYLNTINSCAVKRDDLQVPTVL